MESDLIAELERRIADCPTVCHSDRQHLAALTAAVTLAKAAHKIIDDLPDSKMGVGWNYGVAIGIAREALTLAAKQIGGSDGK